MELGRGTHVPRLAHALAGRWRGWGSAAVVVLSAVDGGTPAVSVLVQPPSRLDLKPPGAVSPTYMACGESNRRASTRRGEVGDSRSTHVLLVTGSGECRRDRRRRRSPRRAAGTPAGASLGLVRARVVQPVDERSGTDALPRLGERSPTRRSPRIPRGDPDGADGEGHRGHPSWPAGTRRLRAR
jgi:hypothetical protein